MEKLTFGCIKEGKKVRFRWGDWECELEPITKKGQSKRGFYYDLLITPEKINEVKTDSSLRLTGFLIRVHFMNPVAVFELRQKFIEWVKIPSLIEVEGQKIEPFFSVEDPDTRFDSYVNSIYNWWLRAKMLKEQVGHHPLYEEKISFIDLSFRLESDMRERGYLEKLKEEKFRLNLILACISNWLRIPCEAL